MDKTMNLTTKKLTEPDTKNGSRLLEDFREVYKKLTNPSNNRSGVWVTNLEGGGG